ncbi:MAG: class I SAM-dependent methyltransferase, partial [Clostridia bacterium]|nr:class I SAM-dependent methyltransferase [Clostridia bacterium]
MKRTVFSELYKNDEYFWGAEPTEFCYQILDKYPPVRYMRLLEIGCGEGLDAVFFARNGYDVTAYDIVPAGIRKTELLAARFGVPVTAFC